LLLVALVLSLGTAQALEADKIAAIKTAAETLQTLAKDSGVSGNPPRASDPQVESLLATVLTTTELEKDNAVPVAQLNLLTGWNVAVLQVMKVYIEAGTGAPALASDANARAAKVDENTAKFMPEVGRSFDAMLWVQAAMLDTVQLFLAAATPQQLDAPNVKTGLGQIRSGAAQTLRGGLQMFVVPGITDEWRSARLRAMVALAPRTAKMVAPEDRVIVSATAREVAARMNLPTVKAALEEIAGILK
jgi:hypothetical protein